MVNPNSFDFAAHKPTFREEEGEIVVAYTEPNKPKYRGIDTVPPHDFSGLQPEAGPYVSPERRDWPENKITEAEREVGRKAIEAIRRNATSN
jgi:hypothetical protein